MTDSGAQVRFRARRRYRSIVRWTASAAALAYLVQAISAGQILGGDLAFLEVHQLGTTVADILVVATVVAATLLRWRARGTLWPLLMTSALLLASQAQAATGASRILRLHVPLGVIVISLAWLLAIGIWCSSLEPGPRRTRYEPISEA